MTEQTQVTNSPTAPGGGNNRMLIIGGIAALAVIAIAVIGAIILIPRLFGADENAIAGVMPPETAVLLELNALNLASNDARRVARAFEGALEEGDIDFNADDPASLLEDLDDQLWEVSGLTITDDILPWIGPNMGIGLLKLDISGLDQGDVPELLFAATIRDTALADRFIEDLIDLIEKETGDNVEEVEYGGALVFEIDSDFEEERLAFGRSGEIFFIATNIDVLEDAIDAQKGENLGDVAEYKQTLDALPGNRAMTIYMSGKALEDSAKAAERSGDFEDFDADVILDLGISGIGMAATFTAEGIRVDMVGSYSNLTEEQKAYQNAQTDKIQTAALLPESTYVFLVGQRLDLIWQNGLTALVDAGVNRRDINEAMNLFDDSFGFNPDKDLMPLLNGEYSVAVIDGDDGLIESEFNVDLGAVVMIGSSNTAGVNELAQDFADGLDAMGMRVRDSNRNGLSLYEIRESGSGTLAAYGVSDKYLVLGTSRGIIESVFGGGASLANSDKYKNVWKAFPRGTTPVMYIDIAGLFTVLEELDRTVEDAAEVNPVYAFAMGTNSKNNSFQTTMIFFIAGE
jgi:hypothetical protein